MVTLLLAWPQQDGTKTAPLEALSTVDFLGAVLLLAASVLLIFAMQQAGTLQYAWNSPATITCLTVSGVCFVALITWQQWLETHPHIKVKAIFPLKVAKSRIMGAAML